MIECFTWGCGVPGSSLTWDTVLCHWARHFMFCFSAGSTQEKSWYDWKIVDWDLKHQHKKQRCKTIFRLWQVHSDFFKLEQVYRVNSLPTWYFSFFFVVFWFFQNQLFRKFLSGVPSECQPDWIKIRPDVLSGLILVQISADDTSR